ncbi:MAG: hypothetical protein ACI85O_000348 [Saprospiraceae bacterium]|jgi:hypothetical protein
MKSIFTRLVAFIALIITTLILTSFYYQSQTRDLGTVLLDSRNIFIQKKIPVEFLFSFEKGERISIRYRENSGSKSKGDIDDLTVRIRNITTGNIESVPVNGYAFTPPSSGNYQLRFETNKRIRLDVRVSKKTGIEARSDEQVEMFSLRNLLVGIEVLGKASVIKRPTFKVKLGEGESVVINSGDDDSGVVKYTLNGKSYMLGQMATVARSGDYDVELYIPLDKEDLKFGLKDLVGMAKDSKQKMLSDLTFSVKVPYIAAEVVVNEAGEIVESPDMSQENAQRRLQESLIEMMNNSQKGTENIVGEFGKTYSDMIGLFEQAFRKDTVLVTVMKAELEIPISLSGKADLNGSPRHCEALGLSGSSNFWIYYIGVGKDVGSAYEEKDRDALSLRSKGLGGVYADAVKDEIFLKKEGRINSVSDFFPTAKGFPGIIFEDVEFAIVNESNRLLFEKNLPFQAYNSVQGKNIGSAHGWLPSAEEQLSVCVCNDNKVTPLDVFFLRQEVSLESQTAY